MLAAGGNLRAAQLGQRREHVSDVLVLGADAASQPFAGLEPDRPVDDDLGLAVAPRTGFGGPLCRHVPLRAVAIHD